jgi:hypothetical protein
MLSGQERGLEKFKIAWGKQRAELGGSPDRWFSHDGRRVRKRTKVGLCRRPAHWKLDTVNHKALAPETPSERPITTKVALEGTTIEPKDRNIDNRYIIDMDI